MPSSYTLGRHFEAFVKTLVSSGRYATASEVMRDGLRLLEDHEAKRTALQEAIEDGLNSGPSESWDAEAVKQAGRQMISGSGGADAG